MGDLPKVEQRQTLDDFMDPQRTPPLWLRGEVPVDRFWTRISLAGHNGFNVVAADFARGDCIWASNDGALMSGTWWAFVPSGAAIALVAFALALINYGVDEVTNPRLRSTRRKNARRREALASATHTEVNR